MHGVATPITVLDQQEPTFAGCPDTINVGRYHSWVVDNEGLPACFKITAKDKDGQVMALTHQDYDVRGVQFHPESVLTEYGKQMIKNWLENEYTR